MTKKKLKKKQPSDKEIKDLLKKAKETAEKPKKKEVTKKETVKQPNKLDTILQKLEIFETTLSRYTQKTDRLENSLSKKDTEEQKAQPTPEQKLEEARKQKEQEARKGQEGQQLTQEQYRAMPDSEKVKFWEGQAAQQAVPQDNFGRAMQVVNALSPIVRTAMMRGGEGGNSNPASAVIEQIKTYGTIQNGLLGNFFKFFKLLSPQDQQAGAKNIVSQAGQVSSPQPRTDRDHIRE